jgi:hypothetical protein
MNDPQFRLVLPDDLLPVQAFLNVLPDDRFLALLEGMYHGVGVDYNGIGCLVPGEEDGPETGILFYVADEELWLSDEQVAMHVRTAVQAYVSCHPDDAGRAQALLDSLRPAIV